MALLKVKINHALIVIDTYLSRTPNIEVQTLENIYETPCESRILFCVELWELVEARKETDEVHGRFCKKLL
jgi:hypothetical protein